MLALTVVSVLVLIGCGSDVRVQGGSKSDKSEITSPKIDEIDKK